MCRMGEVSTNYHPLFFAMVPLDWFCLSSMTLILTPPKVEFSLTCLSTARPCFDILKGTLQFEDNVTDLNSHNVSVNGSVAKNPSGNQDVLAFSLFGARFETETRKLRSDHRKLNWGLIYLLLEVLKTCIKTCWIVIVVTVYCLLSSYSHDPILK